MFFATCRALTPIQWQFFRTFYYVMEYLAGWTLENLVRQKDPAARYEDVAQLDRALADCAAAGQWTDVDAEAWWRSQPAEGSHAAPVVLV